MGYKLDGKNEPQARKDLKALGLDYDKVVSGQIKLNPQQIGNLLDISLERAKNNAQLAVSSFNQQPKEVQEVLTEMNFQLGETGFRKFENFIDAINNKDYDTAAKEIKVNSKGTGPSNLMIDTPNRAQNYVEKILKAKSKQVYSQSVNKYTKPTEKTNDIKTVEKAIQMAYYDLTNPSNKDNSEVKEKYNRLVKYRKDLLINLNNKNIEDIGFIDNFINTTLPNNGLISSTAFNKFGLTDELQEIDYSLPKMETYQEKKERDNEKYRVTKRYEDLNPNSKSPYLAYRYSASNSDPIKVNPFGTRGDRRGSEFKGKGTLMHFLDENPITGFRHDNTKNMINQLDKNDYIGVIENKDKNSYIKYITKEEYDKNPNQGKSFLVRQIKFDDINFDKKIEDSNFKGHTYWTNKKGVIFPLSIGKDETIYDKTSGQSVVFIFKYNGDTRYVHFANSPAEIKKEGQRIKKEYNLKDGDLTIGLGDAGSFSASLRGTNNKITHSALMNNFYNMSGATGAGITFE